MWLECTSESWITVYITKRIRETIRHIRTADRKCTLPKLSSCASYGGGSGCWRSELTSLWVCRVKLATTTFVLRKIRYCVGWGIKPYSLTHPVRSDVLVWLSWTGRDAWPEASAAVVLFQTLIVLRLLRKCRIANILSQDTRMCLQQNGNRIVHFLRHLARLIQRILTCETRRIKAAKQRRQKCGSVAQWLGC